MLPSCWRQIIEQRSDGLPRLPERVILSLLAQEGRVYLSELPEDVGRSVLAVARAAPHSHRDLPLEDFGAQLSHRVEADLLLRRVLKVLKNKQTTKNRLWKGSRAKRRQRTR